LALAIGAGGISSAAATPLLKESGNVSSSFAARMFPSEKNFKGGQAKIEGTKQVGKTLTAIVSGLVPNSSSGAHYKYQWVRNGNAINGATAKTYKLVSADQGKSISVRVTASKADYSTKAIVSESTSKISPAVPIKGSRGNPYPLFGTTTTFYNWEIKITSMEGDKMYYNITNKGSDSRSFGPYYGESNIRLEYVTNVDRSYDLGLVYKSVTVSPNATLFGLEHKLGYYSDSLTDGLFVMRWGTGGEPIWFRR
jgi:hypothetical protein